MFSRNKRGERRASPRVYRLLLATHIIVSVGWLGIVFAKLVLGLRAMMSNAPGVSDALYLSMGVVNIAFPPAAIGTLVTGVLLSLGTKWGLLQHYWVATKLALSVGVIVTGIALVDRLIRQSISAPSVQAVDYSTILGIASAPTTLLILVGGPRAHAGGCDSCRCVQAMGQEVVRSAQGGATVARRKVVRCLEEIHGRTMQ